MPKPSKLHNKGKPQALQKALNNENAIETDENAKQFQLELCWCIQQLERTLNENKGNEKQMQETWKVLTVLKNNNQPIIRKRQLMRTHFGDYRAKMAAEEKKLAKLASKMKISDTPSTQQKATFLRKSMMQSTGDSSFRFNFTLNPEQLDNKIDNVVETPKDEMSNSMERKDNSNEFKFRFSDSEFKFNFTAES